MAWNRKEKEKKMQNCMDKDKRYCEKFGLKQYLAGLAK